MSRPAVSGARMARLAAAAVASALVLAAAAGPSARAATTTTVTCGMPLTNALMHAQSGDVIVLNGLCTNQTYTLPAVAITLEGAAGTTSGFDGTGLTSGPLLGGTLTDSATLTISSLTFEHAHLSATTGGGGLGLVVAGSGGVTLSGDTFTDDTLTGNGVSGAGLMLSDQYAGAGAPAPITITNSVFSDDGLFATGSAPQVRGAGAYIVIDKNANAGDVRALTLSGDAFSSNTAHTTAATATDFNVGGGLAAYADGPGAFPLTQSHDSFVGNAVTDGAMTPASNYGGGGEWAQGFDLSSTGDVFSANTISGTSGAGGTWSWGGGLGILDSACQTGPNPTIHLQSTAANLVAAANTIAGGSAAASNGAGIYLGCAVDAGASSLALGDATVTANAAPAGAVAGIDGGPGDVLSLVNTIDTANAGGGADLGGFGIGGGSGTLVASSSDVCVSGAPPAGPADMCAPPALVGGADVHETAASPTIDAGSTGLVPSGLATDVFGNPRIDRGGAASADIGAAEYVHPPPLASTGDASAVSASGAVLSGSVNPQGTPTTYTFQYGTSTAYGSSTPATVAGAGDGAVAAAATVDGLAAGTVYDYRIVATSAVGSAYGANMTLATAPPLPVVTGLSETHRRWAVGLAARAAGRRHAPIGTTFSYTLNVPAMLTFAFTRQAPGRLLAGVCVAKTRRNARGLHCLRTLTVGILYGRAVAGPGTKVFAGFIGGHWFTPSYYTLHLTATSASGASSAAQTIGFRVVRR